MSVVPLVPLLPLLLIGAVYGITKFELEPQYNMYTGRGDCFTYRVGPAELAMGRAAILTNGPDADYNVGLYIYGSDGSQPISLRDITDAPFSFKTNENAATDYTVCLRAMVRPGRQPTNPSVHLPISLSFTSKHDLFEEARAKQLRLKPLEEDFFNLQQVQKRIADDMSAYLKHEEKLRDLNETALNRLTWLYIVSILVLTAVGLYAMYHLKGFFIYRKLI
jgi:hypothetical protein